MTDQEELLYKTISKKIDHIFYCKISYNFDCLSVAYEYYDGITNYCEGYAADIVFYNDELYWLINNYDIESKHYKLEELDDFIKDFVSYYSSIKNILDILEE